MTCSFVYLFFKRANPLPALSFSFRPLVCLTHVLNCFHLCWARFLPCSLGMMVNMWYLEVLQPGESPALSYFMRWNSFSVPSALSAVHGRVREGYFLDGELFIFVEPLSHMFCNCLSGLYPPFPVCTLVEVLAHPDNAMVLITHEHIVSLLIECQHFFDHAPYAWLIRAGVTHSSMGLGWPLALYLCKEIYHAIEQTLSHEELGECSESRSRSYYSCEESSSYQATSGMYLWLVFLKYVLVLPLWAMQRENFSYFFSVLCCTGYWFCFWVFCLLYPDFLLLCVYFYRPAKTRPYTSFSSSPDVWNQISGLCHASFLYCGV